MSDFPACPSDYDCDPGRFLAFGEIRDRLRRYPRGDVHPGVAARFIAAGARRVLDVGGGTGTLARQLQEHGVYALVVDASPAMLAVAPAPRVRADGAQLPVGDECVDAVAALWTLYHFPDPVAAIREAYRVLRPGGVFAACAPSRYNEPELREFLPWWGAASSFDAEEAPALVQSVFARVDVETWDGQLLTLADTSDAIHALRGQGLSAEQARLAGPQLPTPLDLTKRGCLIYATR
ncbi:MAG: class I SAM-dependent methyltransferase [Mycobacteriales bacterium]